MLLSKQSEIINLFWDSYMNAGLNRHEWKRSSADHYKFSEIADRNGRLTTDGFLQHDTFRIPCEEGNVRLYAYLRTGAYICVMFHEECAEELYVYRYRRKWKIL